MFEVTTIPYTKPISFVRFGLYLYKQITKMPQNEIIIAQTKKWITNVVIGCNFCPFATKELKNDTVYYEVLNNSNQKFILDSILKMAKFLDRNKKVETAFLILPTGVEIFSAYLILLNKGTQILTKKKYKGIYQIASFHPQYLFEGSKSDDASNYTNRSPYPMLHFLREKSITKAVIRFPNIDEIPQKNISFANEKGLKFMQNLLENCI